MTPQAALLAALGAPAGVAWPALPRTAVVVAHPDDETVGAGARLPRLAQALFVYVTDGAPRDGADARRHGLTVPQYAAARQQELAAVFALCGIDGSRLRHLGVPDQQACRRMAELARTLAQLFTEEGIAAVLTQPYEGGHPDHDATAFAVHAAAALIQRAGRTPPALVEMGGYHGGDAGLQASALLADDAADEQLATVQLTPEEQQFKARLIACFTTQQETLRQFAHSYERYRPAARYDFGKRPHAGALWYEQQPWGLTGDLVCELAVQAMGELGLEPPL